jgi:hypothetical protein
MSLAGETQDRAEIPAESLVGIIELPLNDGIEEVVA